MLLLQLIMVNISATILIQEYLHRKCCLGLYNSAPEHEARWYTIFHLLSSLSLNANIKDYQTVKTVKVP